MIQSTTLHNNVSELIILLVAIIIPNVALLIGDVKIVDEYMPVDPLMIN